MAAGACRGDDEAPAAGLLQRGPRLRAVSLCVTTPAFGAQLRGEGGQFVQVIGSEKLNEGAYFTALTSVVCWSPQIIPEVVPPGAS
jgi:hypothetical protein